MSNKYTRSRALFEHAKPITPGAVHSALRTFKPFPLFFKKAHGCRVEDVDGNQYVDYHMGFGAVFLGHNNPAVMKAVGAQMEMGDLCGLGSSEVEYQVAEKIVHHVPSAEMVRFCNSGSEATYHAVRLARAYSKRRKILKFEGAYHGWHDYLNVSVSPPLSSNGSYPESAGSLPETSRQTLVAPYNDLEAAKRLVKENKNDLAAIFVEPIMHNCGVIMPEEGFLEELSQLSEKHGCVLVFDEVITGFRHDLGGAQKILGVTPDLTTLGKALANGFPAAAVCGKKEIMNLMQPTGGVDVSGTYSGHPVSMAAALASIQVLEREGVYTKIFELSRFIAKQISSLIEDFKLDAQVQCYRSIFTVYFTRQHIENYRDLKKHNDDSAFHRYCSKLRDEGVLITPIPRKRCHVSASHNLQDAKRTIRAIQMALIEAAKAKPHASQA